MLILEGKLQYYSNKNNNWEMEIAENIKHNVLNISKHIANNEKLEFGKFEIVKCLIVMKRNCKIFVSIGF